jgi:hypothetical protein
MARTTKDPNAKAKKQKIVLAAGGVILLGLLAFQLPKLMKGSPTPPTSAVASTTTTAAGTAPVASATGAAPSQSSVPTSAELTFAPSVDKVASLSRFPAKDPFKPRVSISTAGAAGGTAADTGAPKAVPPPATTSAAKGPLFGTVEGSPAAPTKSGSNGTTSKGTSLPGATIMFNGKRLHLVLGQAFPKSKPVFRLSGIQSGSVILALVKGGLADGSSLITLPSRHPVTIVNTVDKTRYTMVLLAGKKGA